MKLLQTVRGYIPRIKIVMPEWFDEDVYKRMPRTFKILEWICLLSVPVYKGEVQKTYLRMYEEDQQS